MDITHDNVCSSMLSCFYSHLLSTGRPISSFVNVYLLHCYTYSSLFISKLIGPSQSADMALFCSVCAHMINFSSKSTRPRDMLFLLKDTLSIED